MIRLFCIVSLLLTLSPIWGETVPALTGPVIDQTGMLSAGERQQVQQLVETLNASGKVQLAILIASSLQGYEIEPFSIKVVEKWQLGRKGVDDGLLLIVAPSEHRMRFEVGYGLEGEIPDVVAKRILSDQMAPYFRQNRFGDGLRVAIEAVAQRLQIPLDSGVEKISLSRRADPRGHFSIWIFLLIILAVFVTMIFGGGRHYGGGGGGFGGGGGWGGGSGGFGGGGFGGGGGGFGGGGSSSSW